MGQNSAAGWGEARATFSHDLVEAKRELVAGLIEHKRAPALPALYLFVRLEHVEGFPHRPGTYAVLACEVLLIRKASARFPYTFRDPPQQFVADLQVERSSRQVRGHPRLSPLA